MSDLSQYEDLHGIQGRIIVIDDDEIDGMVTGRYLRRLMPDAETELIDNGPDALSRLSEVSATGQNVLLVFIDQKLPGMTGLEILQRLQETGLSDRVPFVLFSSAVAPTEVEAVLAAGARDYVVKPIEPDEYLKSLAEAVRRHAPASRAHLA